MEIRKIAPKEAIFHKLNQIVTFIYGGNVVIYYWWDRYETFLIFAASNKKEVKMKTKKSHIKGGKLY